MLKRTFFVLTLLIFSTFCQNTGNQVDSNTNSTTISVDPQNPTSSASIQSNSNQYGNAQANSNANLSGNSGTGQLTTNTYTTPEGGQGSSSSSNVSSGNNDSNNNSNAYSTTQSSVNGNGSAGSFGTSNVVINGQPVGNTAINSQAGQPNNNDINNPANTNIDQLLNNLINNNSNNKNNANKNQNNSTTGNNQAQVITPPTTNTNVPVTTSSSSSDNNNNTSQIIITVVPDNTSNVQAINSTLALNKVSINGTVSFISVGPSGNILYADNNNNVFSFQENTKQQSLVIAVNKTCPITKIVTSFNGQPYVVTDCGNVYFRDSIGAILLLNNCARDIDVGIDGQLVKVSCNANNNGEFEIQRLFCNGNAFFASIFIGWNGFNCNWYSANRNAVKVYLDNFSRLYAIRANGLINFVDAQGSWNALDGLKVKSLSLDNAGNIYAIDINNNLYAINPNNNFSVKQLATGVKEASSGPYGRIYLIDFSGNAYFINTNA